VPRVRYSDPVSSGRRWGTGSEYWHPKDFRPYLSVA
jgi:hypothetical protein